MVNLKIMKSTPKDLVPDFFDNTSKTYDRVVNYATFGKDRFWKNKIITEMKNPKTILDLACGTGILTRKIAKAFPESEIIGIDITQSYLEVAKKNSLSFSNVSFIHQDAEMLNIDKKFDCICSSYIPKYCNANTLIKKCVKHLNANGRIILHDFIYPKNPVVKFLWNSYFVLLQLSGFLIPSWKDAFQNLPSLIKTTNWTNDYAYHLKQNGFKVKVEPMTWHTSAILAAQK